MDGIFDFSVNMCLIICRHLLSWFTDILTFTDMYELWIGVVVFTAVFSIVILPLRGGIDLSRGVFGSFLMNKVNRHRNNDD